MVIMAFGDLSMEIVSEIQMVMFVVICFHLYVLNVRLERELPGGNLRIRRITTFFFKKKNICRNYKLHTSSATLKAG